MNTHINSNIAYTCDGQYVTRKHSCGIESIRVCDFNGPPLPHYKLLIPNGYIYISGRSRPISPSRAFSIRYEKIIIGSSTMFRSCFLHLTPIVRMSTPGIHKIPWQYYSPDAEVRHACLPLCPQIRVNFIFQSFIEIFFHIH